MPGPGPRYQSQPVVNRITGVEVAPVGAVQAARMQAAIAKVEQFVAKASPPFQGGTPASGSALDAANSACRYAGLGADWPTVRAKSFAIGVRIPGHEYGPGPAYAESFTGSGELLRAWAARYAPDLIDPTAEQHAEAWSSWFWW
ncbi:MAG: hypothetical protein JSS20_22335 [Proteobacteria bacterium]|nr:hypothetical protein [Pseudomonadota bacterium]